MNIKLILTTTLLCLLIPNVQGTVPAISSIWHDAYNDAAYVHWTSDLTANNRVEYSVNSDMSSSSWSSWLNDTATPAISITGLTRDTTYYYNVTSENGGDTNTPVTQSFKTENNTHGFSRYFDRTFKVNDLDGWSVGESMTETYEDTVGEYVFWTLVLGAAFMGLVLITEGTILPATLALVTAAVIFPLLPPEFDVAIKVLLGLAISGYLWHLFISRR